MAKLIISDLSHYPVQHINEGELSSEEQNLVIGGLSLCPSPGQSSESYLNSAITAGGIAGALVGSRGGPLGIAGGAAIGMGFGAIGGAIGLKYCSV